MPGILVEVASLARGNDKPHYFVSDAGAGDHSVNQAPTLSFKSFADEEFLLNDVAAYRTNYLLP